MKATRKIVSVICVILIAMSTLALTGCGNDGSSSSKKSFDPKKLAGKYELIEMTSGDDSYSEEDLETLKSYGFTISMELNEDGTGTMNFYGEEEEFTFDEDNIIVNDEKTPYTVDGDKITFEQDDTKMVFKKINE